MSTSRSQTLAALGVVVVGSLAFALVAWAMRGQHHPGGDPRGSVLRTMLSIRDAVPAGAMSVTTWSSDAEWLPPCPQFAQAQAGWGEALVSVTFADRAPGAHIDSLMAQQLQRSGWAPEPMRITKGQGLVPHWVRKVRGSPPIDAFAYSTPAGSTTWHLTASWRPPGPVAQQCP